MALNKILIIYLILLCISAGASVTEQPTVLSAGSSDPVMDTVPENESIADSGLLTPDAAGEGLITIGTRNPEFVRYQEIQSEAIGNKTGLEHSLGDSPSPVYHPEVVDIPEEDPAVQEFAPVYDMREEGKVSQIRDQNGWGTCWAFASCGSLESFLLPGENRTFSPKNLVNLNGLDGDEDSGGGIYKSMASFTRWQGPVDEQTDPYPFRNWSSSLVSPPVVHVQDVIVYPARTNRTDTRSIKAGLQRWGAPYVGIYWDDSFYNNSSSSYYQPETASNPSSGGGHAVNLVGWNDTFPASAFNQTPPGDGAWIVKNSWGDAWGDKGFFYVSYYDKYLGSALDTNKEYRSTAFYTSEPVNNYEHVYLYDPLGVCDEVRFGTPMGGTFANRFTTTSPGILSAIGFYTTDLNVQYDATICMNPINGPVGTEVARVSGFLPTMGYHTIPLPVESQVPLSTGETFSVILTLTNHVNPYFAAIERPVEGYSSNATSNPGESYFTVDNGSTFIDLYSQLPDSNFCIKAYTLPGPVPQPERLKAAFTAKPVFGQSPLIVQFTDTSSGSPTRWFWSFGDGNQSVVQNPVKIYTNPGFYSVSLVVRNGEKADQVSKWNYIAVKDPAAGSP